ncbi:MAG: tyrosine-type recombinase/integrase [Methylomonas sp.]|nr:tyrosine-type recombinase/integrase [Methylomonas sp.]
MSDNTLETRTLFTKKWIDLLPPNAPDAVAREKEYSDTQVVGLKLLVNKQGRKFFYLRYTINKRKRGIKIGEYGPMSLIEARQAANELKAQINKGIDPQEEKQQLLQIPTFEEFVTKHYLPHAYANKRSAHADESKLRIHLLPLLKNRRLDQITTQELQRYHDQMKSKYTPATSNRHLSLLHRMFKLAVYWGFIGNNPATGIRKHQENNERQRYLSDDEIARFIDALRMEENQVAAAAFAFLLYTGARRQEALDAKWEHVDLQRRSWFIPMSKSGKSRNVILNRMAIDLLMKQVRIPGNPYIFPGKVEGNQLNNPQKAFARVLKKADIKNFRIHDLRHSHASIAINNGASLYEVQHLLGHSQSKTTTRYAHLADETLRKVSDTISHTIANVIG